MKWIFFSAGLLCLASCTPDTRLLEGEWRIAGYFREGQSVATPMDSVGLVFHPNQTYEFRSMGYYRERGSFRTSGSYLFLLDSTRKEAKEQALKILYLSKDTLKLKMQRDSMEEIVFWGRMSQ